MRFPEQDNRPTFEESCERMSRRDEMPTSGDGAFTSMLNAARANAPWAFERLFTTYAPRVKAYVLIRR